MGRNDWGTGREDRRGEEEKGEKRREAQDGSEGGSKWSRDNRRGEESREMMEYKEEVRQ